MTEPERLKPDTTKSPASSDDGPLLGFLKVAAGGALWRFCAPISAAIRQEDEDDLFWRVWYACNGGIILGVLGAACLIGLYTHDISHFAGWVQLLMWIGAGAVCLGAVKNVIEAFDAGNASVARFVKNKQGLATDNELEGFLFIVLALPISLLTLVLRRFGVRGRRYKMR